MNDQIYLLAELEKIKTSIDPKQWKYYYLQSVENFIFHLNSFSRERTRETTAIEILNYLMSVKEQMNIEASVHSKGKALFPAIWHILQTYKYELGFIQRPGHFVIFIILLVLFI